MKSGSYGSLDVEDGLVALGMAAWMRCLVENDDEGWLIAVVEGNSVFRCILASWMED